MNACFAYLRVSGKGQVDGDGFPRQVAAIEKYAAANALEIRQIFREEGVCGATDLDNRPALQALYAALETSDVRTVVIEKLDRLARDLMVQETIVADMRKHGYELISTYEPDLCSDDPSRKLVRQIFGAIAEYDRAMVVLKLRGARQRKRARHGRCEGRHPFGFHTHEQPILTRILKLRHDGLLFAQIATQLNTEGLKTRTGGSWSAGTISKICARLNSARTLLKSEVV